MAKKQEETVARRRVVTEEPAKETAKEVVVAVQEQAKTDAEQDPVTTQAAETQSEDPAGGAPGTDDPEAQANPSTLSSLEVAEAPPAASGSPFAAQLRASGEVTEEDLEMVVVSVPKAYKLRVTNDLVLDIKAGAQRLERFIADHWYSKANGLTKVE